MKNRDSIYSFILLFISVCALTIGFAAYSKTLSIVDSSAEVKPSNSLNVHFPTSGTITPTLGTATSSGDTITLNSGTVISNLKAYFKAPGDYITYETSFINDSSYDAYLKSIDFSYGSPICNAYTDPDEPNPASSDILSSVCNNLKVYVTVDDLVVNATGDVNGLENKKLEAGESIPVTIKISFDGTDNSDGDFVTDFGDIYFHFSSVDA